MSALHVPSSSCRVGAAIRLTIEQCPAGIFLERQARNPLYLVTFETEISQYSVVVGQQVGDLTTEFTAASPLACTVDDPAFQSVDQPQRRHCRHVE